MTVVLDQKDVQAIDDETRADSRVWNLFVGNGKISASDFTGVKTVRINKFGPLAQPTQYKRNAENARQTVEVSKESVELTHEDWMGYDLDELDMNENGALTIANLVTQYRKNIAIPRHDKVAVEALVKNAGKTVTDTVSKDNILDAYDDAEAYMTDSEVAGNFVMLVGADTYKLLKNATGVSRTFTTNQQAINGINRTVGQIDGSVPIIPVPKDRLAGLDLTDTVNFILAPTSAIQPIEKLNDVTAISPDSDRGGYRWTVKWLNYFDAIALDGTKKGIYVSLQGTKGTGGAGK